jgi:hypothetical protein
MYLVIRKFNHVSSVAEAARRAESGIGQVLKQSPGFQDYYVFDAGDGVGGSVRWRERARQGFRSARGLQRFVNVFSAVRNLFVPPRSRRSARATHLHRLNAMAEWKSAANIAA